MTSWWSQIPHQWSIASYTACHMYLRGHLYPFQTPTVARFYSSGTIPVNPIHNWGRVTWGLCAYVQVETPGTHHLPQGSILVTVRVPAGVPAHVLVHVPCAVHSGVTVSGDKTM